MLRTSNKGLTILELVMVIGISAALYAIAAPRIVDMRTNAVIASVKGMEAALHAAKNSVRSRCALQPSCNMTSGLSWVTHQSGNVRIWNGWPDAGDNLQINEIDLLIESSGFVLSLLPAHSHRWTPVRAKEPEGCYVQYREALSPGQESTVIAVTDGC